MNENHDEKENADLEKVEEIQKTPIEDIKAIPVIDSPNVLKIGNNEEPEPLISKMFKSKYSSQIEFLLGFTFGFFLNIFSFAWFGNLRNNKNKKIGAYVGCGVSTTLVLLLSVPLIKRGLIYSWLTQRRPLSFFRG